MKIRNTISGRLTLQVLFLAVVVFLAAFLLFFRMSGDKVREEAFKHAESELSKTVYQIDGMIISFISSYTLLFNFLLIIS